jgi:hypothetical protein
VKTYRVVAISREANRALGGQSHHVQVEVIGAFKSKAAFARALAAAGLFYNERQALSQIAFSGGETWNAKSIQVTTLHPETLFVGPLDHKSADAYMRWPQP